MLIVQQYHSIHEIEQEFIPSLELLLEEEIPHFDFLIKKHDESPESEMFTYYLFFGPKQNQPVGFAHIGLQFLPDDYRTFTEKMKFWNKDHKHWKQFDWTLKGTSLGTDVFGQKAGIGSREKIQEILGKYLGREDIVAFNIFHHKATQEGYLLETAQHSFKKDHYFLGPLVKTTNSYQEYLLTLERETQNEIKNLWKNLHRTHQIELGEYPHILEAPKSIPFDEKTLEFWNKMNAGLLTFEKEGKVLGCILMIEGKNGNFFFEPFPFEAMNESQVSDTLYIQYALLKFFEHSYSRKCHILKNLNKLSFQEKEDLSFFADQGFTSKHLVQCFSSRLATLKAPV